MISMIVPFLFSSLVVHRGVIASFFQRLCEELEYSELLDKAAEYDDPYERMVGIAVSVSFL